MTKSVISLIVGFILGLYLAASLSKGCNNTPSAGKYDTLKHTIDTLFVPKDSIVYKKGKDIIKLKDTTIYLHDTLLAEKIKDVDTLAILKDFYAKNIYKDSLSFGDSLGWVKVYDTVSENKLQARTYNFKVINKIITKETILREKFKAHIYVGVTTNGGLGFIYTTPTKWAFSANITSKTPSFGAYYRIK